MIDTPTSPEVELAVHEESMEREKVQEACGVAGVWLPDNIYGQPEINGLNKTATLIRSGLFKLQHRGQDTAGIAIVKETGDIHVEKNAGLVEDVLTDKTLSRIHADGRVGIGHVRYGTFNSGAPNPKEKAQPFLYITARGRQIALSQNGHESSAPDVYRQFGHNPIDAVTDGQMITEVIGDCLDLTGGSNGDIVKALQLALPKFDKGSFSLTIVHGDTLVGVRDTHGFKPLVLGRFSSGGYMFASEVPALSASGAQFMREVEPGEIVAINNKGIRSEFFGNPEPTLCAFEFAYFAKPDNVFGGQNVGETRIRTGIRLAEQGILDVDSVVPVPESGILAARGFAAASGIPLDMEALTIHPDWPGTRTFILSTQKSRAEAAEAKLVVDPMRVEGKRLAVVDDSLVRGHVIKTTIRMLRNAGAVSVDLVVAFGPVKSTCHYGVDIPNKENLIAPGRTLSEIAQLLGARSILYATEEDQVDAIGLPKESLCMHCITNEDPIKKIGYKEAVSVG